MISVLPIRFCKVKILWGIPVLQTSQSTTAFDSFLQREETNHLTINDKHIFFFLYLSACDLRARFCACVHLIPNWSMLAEAPVRDPSPPQAKGPSPAASPTQMDLAAGDCPCKPPGPSPTDGVSQWEHRHTSIPIKARPASAMTFRRCVLLGEKGREFSFMCLLWRRKNRPLVPIIGCVCNACQQPKDTVQ